MGTVGAYGGSGGDSANTTGATAGAATATINLTSNSILTANAYANYGINVNAPHPHAAALFVDFVLSADGAKILSGTGRIPTRKGARSVYEELSNLEEKGVPIFVVTAEQTDEVAKPMEKIMKELLTR